MIIPTSLLLPVTHAPNCTLGLPGIRCAEILRLGLRKQQNDVRLDIRNTLSVTERSIEWNMLSKVIIDSTSLSSWVHNHHDIGFNGEYT